LAGFVLEDGVEPGELQETANFCGKIAELQRYRLTSGGSQCADQLTRTSAVCIANVAWVQKNILCAFIYEVVYGFA